MSHRTISASWLADYMEAQARADYVRERSLNDFCFDRNPSLQATPEYLAGPLPAHHPRFSSAADHYRYLQKREFARWNKEYALRFAAEFNDGRHR
jgi:hypothetical protein